ncbi:hypothetical protein VTJ49DRAFT_3811 [Mycothermus thermophilus]|uniref:Uncharacterized protein n=1 Tax=Humicola insolens TaxID=85995 RepID=A0ABR3VQF5_HUMIN
MAPPSDTNTNTSATAVAVFLDSTFPSNRHVFLRPSPLLPAGSLQIAKDTLDVLAGQVADQQQQRLREAGGKKRKRDGTTDKTAPLKIRKVHVDGFETGQVWQQARKIITSALAESEQILAELEANDEVVNGVEAKEEGDAMVNGDGEEGSDVSEEEEESASGDEFEEFSDEEAEVDAGDDNLSEADLDEEEEEGEEDEDVESGSEEGEEDGYDDEPEDEYVEDPFGLNDGFFSIDEFNKQTQWFEDQDARGDPNTDVLSEDESIDWHADPFAPKKPKKKANGDDADESEEESDEEDDDEGGAGLSKEDLANQLDAESDDEEEGNLDDEIADMGLDLTANDIYYKDFFAPPKKKKKPGNKPKRQEPARPFRPDDADIERAENDVRRDLFEDLSERSDEEDALSDVSAGDPKSRRSAHERRQAKIAEEIRRLEAELRRGGDWVSASIALDERIGNDNGNLKFV